MGTMTKACLQLDLPRYRVLDVPFNPITRSGTREHCMSAVSSDRFHLMVTLGTEMVMDAQENDSFRQIVEEADLVVPDGIGVVIASRLAGLQAPERVTGVELVHDLVQASNDDVGFFFYGSAPGIAEKAVSNLKDKVDGFNCVGIRDGYVKDPEEVLKAIEETNPRVLFVALGSPRQEAFLSQNRARLEASGVRLGVGVGGSLDVYAGTVERAPQWVQKIHMEWAYRLLKQPSRWRRMLALPRFAIRVLLSPKRAVRSVS
jgi:N-acetylglucosaminyldiphosphoundecaprenol N-acetyl-beta-D-mannosaminyltransferase